MGGLERVGVVALRQRLDGRHRELDPLRFIASAIKPPCVACTPSIGGRRASETLTGKIEPKLFKGSGFAISCIGHMAILALGLIFAGANPFDSAPVDAITVEIVSPNEFEGIGKPGVAATAPSFEPVAPASRAQPTPPSQPEATAPPDP